MIRFDLILHAQSKVLHITGPEIISAYNQYASVSLPLSSPWCAAAISVIMREMDIPTTVLPNFHSCTQFMGWAKQHYIWHEPNEKHFIPLPSDLLFFDWDHSGDADHIGIITGFDGKTIYTIEGNANNQCKQKEYHITNPQIRGYIRPNYPRNNYAGIDISTFQKSVNYNLINSCNIDFIILRSSMTYQKSHKQDIDAMLNKHYMGISNLDIPIGYYHYSVATTEELAAAEANYMIKCLKNKRVDLPLFMDVEDMQLKSLGKDKLMQVIQTFQHIIEKQGYTFGLYTGKQFTDNNLIDMAWIKQNQIPLWYAQYYTSITSAYLSDIDIWQFNSGGNLADYKIRFPFIGQSGIDVNISYVAPKELYNKKETLFSIPLGWFQKSGKWYYKKTNSTMAKNEWLEIKGHWYRFNEEGVALKGWYQDTNNHLWFYLNETKSPEFPECAMQTGWKEIIYNGIKSWYYFETEPGKEKGHMYSNQSFLSKDGNWYSFGADGRME